MLPAGVRLRGTTPSAPRELPSASVREYDPRVNRSLRPIALALAPRDCGFAAINTGREIVHLAIGVGDHWVLEVDADRRVQGTAQPRARLPATR
jgi:hypothetical protein